MYVFLFASNFSILYSVPRLIEYFKFLYILLLLYIHSIIFIYYEHIPDLKWRNVMNMRDNCRKVRVISYREIKYKEGNHFAIAGTLARLGDSCGKSRPTITVRWKIIRLRFPCIFPARIRESPASRKRTISCLIVTIRRETSFPPCGKTRGVARMPHNGGITISLRP